MWDQSLRQTQGASLILCDHCQRHYVGTAATGRSACYRYYTCQTRQRSKGCQADRLIADTLDDAVLRAAIDTFERTDLIDDADRAPSERSGVNRHNREEELATVKAALKDTEDSIERYLTAFEARTMPETLCGERIRTLGVRVVELRERREDLEASLDADAIVLPTEQQIAAVRGKLREALEHGDRPARKRLLQSVVAEIRVYSRHKIQTYFRVPGTNDAPEGAVRAPCTRVEVTVTNPKNGPAMSTSDFSLATRKRTLPNCRDEIVTALESLIAEVGHRSFLVREVYERMVALGTSYAEPTVYKAMQRMKQSDPRLPGVRLERVDADGFRLIKDIAS